LKRSDLAPWQRNLWAIVVAEVMTLLSFQASFILIPYYLQDLGVHDVAQVAAWTGAYQSLGAIGFAIATPMLGALIVAGTPTTTVFYVAGIAFALVTILNVVVRPRPARASVAVEEAEAPPPASASTPQCDRA